MRAAKVLVLALAACLVVMGMATAAWATNGYQLTGIGSQQLSMGGAVTAAPMDAMTAVTNPAGMCRVGKRADFSVEAFMPLRTVDFTETGGESLEGGSGLYGIPSLGWTAPIGDSGKLYFGGGMFVTSGLGVDYGQSTMLPGAALDFYFGPGHEDVTFDGYSAIQFWKMAPALAWQANDKLSIGAALNIDYQSVTIMEKIRGVPFLNDPSDPMQGITQMDVSLDLGRPTNQLGFGGSVGLIYDINKELSVGATYISRQYFEGAQYRVGDGDVSLFNGATGEDGLYDLYLDFPQQAAVGLSYKPFEPLLIAFDVKWIDWSSTHSEVKLKGPEDSFMESDGSLTNETELKFGWEDQWVYALGVQYAATKDLRFRVGYNYAEAPINKKDVFNNLIFPAIVEHHASVGFDYRFDEHWGVAISYMKAFKKTLEGDNDVSQDMQDVTIFTSDSGSIISLEEDSLSMQLTYMF